MKPVFADNDNPGHADYNDRDVYQQDLRNQCQSLITQFDNQKTSNATALALRNKAWNNCVSSMPDDATKATTQMKQALKMIGVEPKVM